MFSDLPATMTPRPFWRICRSVQTSARRVGVAHRLERLTFPPATLAGELFELSNRGRDIRRWQLPPLPAADALVILEPVNEEVDQGDVISA
jgi:hypothetical protein